MIVPSDIEQAAAEAQHAAAHDRSEHVCVVAGPGAGKSTVLGERVRWLIQDRGVSPEAIRVVSFTRSSARDLAGKIRKTLEDAGVADPQSVRVTTLHSLALGILKAAGRLEFATQPCVLDDWEVRNVCDAEFGVFASVSSVGRREAIRVQQEALWSEADWRRSGIGDPDPPVSDDERAGFVRFYEQRSRLYGFVIPGFIVRRCYEYLQGVPDGHASAASTTAHLVVDEYQDLNPMDLRLVAEMARRGTSIFVAGDDDQSIYRFRYASPEGIQNFEKDFGAFGDAVTHRLRHCFRCPNEVLEAAEALLKRWGADGRIRKDYVSVPSAATPPVRGFALRASFRGNARERRWIAKSCRRLVDAGIPAPSIAILVPWKSLIDGFSSELEGEGLDCMCSVSDRFIDQDAGRAALCLARVVVSPEDHVALRVLLGMPRNVAAGTANEVARAAIADGRTYREVFTRAWDGHGLSGRAVAGIATVAGILLRLGGTDASTSLADVVALFGEVIETLLDESASTAWREWAAGYPPQMTVGELRTLLWASSDADVLAALGSVMRRLAERGESFEGEPDDQDGVCLMTLHSSKGLTADVVFIPVLENGYLPDAKALQNVGLLQEAARVVFVGLTRARVAVVLSYANWRFFNGKNNQQDRSEFCDSLGVFAARDDDALDDEELNLVVKGFENTCAPKDEEACG